MDIHKPKPWHGWREFLKLPIFVLIAGSMLFADCGEAQAKTIIGSGARESCGAWLADPSPQGQCWVFGWLSRSSFLHEGDMIDPVDGEGIKAWVDRYHSAHPLDKLVDAARALELELAARAVNSKPKERYPN